MLIGFSLDPQLPEPEELLLYQKHMILKYLQINEIIEKEQQPLTLRVDLNMDENFDHVHFYNCSVFFRFIFKATCSFNFNCG